MLSSATFRPMTDTLTVIANLAILTFVLTSMVSMGLSLSVSQILEPLSNVSLVVRALIANFVVAPLAAWGLAELLDLDDPLALGLIIVGAAAGAPFLPKLGQIAKGDVAYSVGLMTVLMVVTIAYIPLVIVPLIPEITVSPWEIAEPLVFFMLIPLALALIVRARYEGAKHFAPTLSQVSTVALLFGLVIAIGLALPTLWDAFGTGAYLGAIGFSAIALITGWLLGGSTRATKVVTSLGTGQRNLSAALLIATTSFMDEPLVFVMVMVVGTIGMIIILPAAAELGRRAE